MLDASGCLNHQKKQFAKLTVALSCIYPGAPGQHVSTRRVVILYESIQEMLITAYFEAFLRRQYTITQAGNILVLPGKAS